MGLTPPKRCEIAPNFGKSNLGFLFDVEGKVPNWTREQWVLEVK